MQLVTARPVEPRPAGWGETTGRHCSLTACGRESTPGLTTTPRGRFRGLSSEKPLPGPVSRGSGCIPVTRGHSVTPFSPVASAQLGFLLMGTLAVRSALARAPLPAGCSQRPVALAAPAGPRRGPAGGGGLVYSDSWPLRWAPHPPSEAVCGADCDVGTALKPSWGRAAPWALSSYCALFLLLAWLFFSFFLFSCS